MAGWAIPHAVSPLFPPEGSQLERYASRFAAVEINSSFHRPHRRSTYERWAASVPAGFRFAVKLPKEITHGRRLQDGEGALDRFAGEIAGLGPKRGPVLVQLPPSLAFDAAVAQRFFAEAGQALGGALVCEPRHPSWFGEEADALLAEARVARVVADPAVTPAGLAPGGWRGRAYCRLHGSPVMYRSSYPPEAIGRHAALVRAWAAADAEVWTVFDNTALGAATADALALKTALALDTVTCQPSFVPHT